MSASVLSLVEEAEHRPPQPPLLALHDVCAPFSFSGADHLRVFGGIAALLGEARRIGAPVAHFYREGEALPPGAGCAPRVREMVFQRRGASCFTAEYFADIALGFLKRGIIFVGVDAASAASSLADAAAYGAPAFCISELLAPPLEESRQRRAAHDAGLLFIATAGRSIKAPEWRAAFLELKG